MTVANRNKGSMSPASSNVDRFLADQDCVSTDPSAAVHRLAVALAGTSGVADVARIILRHMVGAVRTGGAAMAASGRAVPFGIVATYSDPRHASAALQATIRGRADAEDPRAEVGRVLIHEITVGERVLAVVCLTDKLDGAPFTRADLATVQALAATAALALEREAVRAHGEVFARAAAIDPVSGLFNRRHFQSRLEEELQRARRSATTVALLMIDLDDFKRINDTYGHAAGDATIRAAATIIRRAVRHFDICTRYGGEEFAVVMPDSSASTATTVAERIRSRIAAWRSSEPHAKGLQITTSIGFALSDPSTSMDDLLAHADRALYEAKEAGKNQVRVAAVSL
jgi:diguanylate cyclase (GGDEF)-like protein